MEKELIQKWQILTVLHVGVGYLDVYYPIFQLSLQV